MQYRQLRESILKLFCSPEQFARKLGARIGSNCRIKTYYWGSEPFLIEIGNHVHITRDVKFVTHDGAVWVFREQFPDVDVFGKITIGDNTFIGNEAMILPGVRIGSNCIIGAMSVVTHSIADHSVVAGNPAKYICSTGDYFERIKSYFQRTKHLTPSQRDQLILNLPMDQQLVKAVLKMPGS
ncbi:MAG: acyltransferase [Calditrichaeota bacterium]|nr:MAG: acyltransferase [Calditrichota bacterium]